MPAERGQKDASRRVGLSPISAPDARILVLGSMPGAASLKAARYYAHPRNAFWPIVSQLFGLDLGQDYERRLASLRACGVALWDVLHDCVRPGSLDADIEARDARPNDFAGFYAQHPRIQAVCFNGAAAHALYRRHVMPAVGLPAGAALLRLPSTSPAHAAMPLAAKTEAWGQALAPFMAPYRPPRARSCR